MGKKDIAFRSVLEDWWEPVWRGCFALVLDEEAAHQAAYRTFLQVAMTDSPPDRREEQVSILLRNMVRVCEDHYYRKPRRKPKREELDRLWFPVDDALYAFFQGSFSHRAAFWIHFCMGFPIEDTAKILHTSPRRTARLAKPAPPHTPAVLKKSAEAVRPPEGEGSRLTDELLIRLDENFVKLDVGAYRFKSALDRAIPWIALGLVAFGIFAAVYSALYQGAVG